MSDETEKHCMCGCIYLESDCPNCNKVTDAMRIEELEAIIRQLTELNKLQAKPDDLGAGLSGSVNDTAP